jgi:hypothetical protein
MTAMPPTRRLYVHIGLQKTGTSYLQNIMWLNQDRLRELGLDLVPETKRATFDLMLAVRERYDAAFDPPGVATALQKLPQELAAASQPAALITEESIAAATSPQIVRFLAACADREVHVVITLRDLGRQIPSAWQQTLQSGGQMPYPRYLSRLRTLEGRPRTRLWANKDVAAILERWSDHVPVERTHLVTVPPPGSPKQELLERFGRALAIDVARLDRDVARSNESIGRVQAELLRRINAGLAPEFRSREVYGDVGKRYLAMRVLGPQQGEKIRVPPEYEEWCRDVSQRFVDVIVKGGYPVEGDVLDLIPSSRAFAPQARVTPREVADASVAAMTTMLTDDMTRLRTRRRKVAESPRWSLQRLRRRLSDGRSGRPDR